MCLADHRGVIGYEPTELVITARAGTPLVEIETVLAKESQMLAFEPPHFGPSATLGGTLASALSGPRRPYAGAARDFVLGTRIVNGQGEVLRFGGEVIKNVAGYDEIAHRERFTLALRLGQFFRPLLPASLRRSVPAKQRAEEWPELRHPRRMLVLEGCVQPGIAPNINAAAARVLDRLGISLLVHRAMAAAGLSVITSMSMGRGSNSFGGTSMFGGLMWRMESKR